MCCYGGLSRACFWHRCPPRCHPFRCARLAAETGWVKTSLPKASSYLYQCSLLARQLRLWWCLSWHCHQKKYWGNYVLNLEVKMQPMYLTVGQKEYYQWALGLVRCRQNGSTGSAQWHLKKFEQMKWIGCFYRDFSLGRKLLWLLEGAGYSITFLCFEKWKIQW